MDNTTQTKYEYELVYRRQISDYLKEGWEPVPNTDKVIGYELATPMEYSYLRRKV